MTETYRDITVHPEYLDEKISNVKSELRGMGLKTGHFINMGITGEGYLKIRIPFLRYDAPTEEDFIKSTSNPDGIYNAFKADSAYRECTIGRPEIIAEMPRGEFLTRIKVTYPLKENDLQSSGRKL